jgi:hypothetical protein
MRLCPQYFIVGSVLIYQNKYYCYHLIKFKIQHLIKFKIQHMPNLKIEKETFFELMGERYTFDWLDNLGF